MGEKDEADSKFGVLAEAKEHNKPLILTDLSFGRLMDDVVVPYQNGDSFFIDGVPVRPADLTKLKIVEQDSFLDTTLGDLHHQLRTEDSPQLQKVLGEQYHVRVEALLRESGRDVTAQIIKAFTQEIEPKLSDYLLNRSELIGAASRAFAEAMKALASG